MKPTHGGLTWVTGRVAGALGIGAVLADTGALPAGKYYFRVNLAQADIIAAGVGLFVEHRNAANAATLKDLGGSVPGGGGPTELEFDNYPIVANERLRVVGGSAASGAASLQVAAIGYQKLD